MLQAITPLYADHVVTTRADVGPLAQITADHVAVNATDFLLDGFNIRVGSTAAGKTLAAAGAVNLTFMRNDTRAWVDAGAQITTSVNDGLAWGYSVKEVGFESDLVKMLIPINTYKLDKDLGVLGDFVSDTRVAPSGPALDEINFARSFNGSTVVRATTSVQTLHHAGGAAPEAGGSGTVVGGTFSMVDRQNTTIAGIADRAAVTTHRAPAHSGTCTAVRAAFSWLRVAARSRR